MTDQQVMENTLARHLRRTLILAWPMILSRVGIVTMHSLDVIVLGRAGAQELADYVLGAAIQDSLIGVTIGALLGVPVLVARETGAGRHGAAGAVWRRGMVMGMVLGLGLCALLQFAELVYAATGQDPDLAVRAGRVTGVLAFTMPFIAGYYVSAAFLEALHKPGIALAAIALANAANLALNVILVFGAGPIPAMGAMGCALATVLTFALLCAGMAVYVTRIFPERARYGIGLRAGRRTGRRTGRRAVRRVEQIRIGLASGASMGIEATAFTVMTLFIGRLGTLALAAHGVLFQFLALTFMVAYGIAGATQVRVGNAWGRGDPSGMARAGWIGLALAVAGTGTATAAYAVFPLSFLGIFTPDPAVIAAAAPVLIWVVLGTIFDGGQSVMNGACRGRGDAWVPTAMHFGSYWLVMVPAAGLLAFPGGQGLAGIYQGILIASVVSLGVLSLRFRALCRAAPSPRSR